MGTVQALRDVEGKKPVGLADVQAAAARIGDSIIRTPCLESRTLSEITGARVFLKFENLQFTAAYKERGALNKLLLLDETAKSRGVIAASAGNHAQGLAYHGRRLGIPVTIVMPRPTPIAKVSPTGCQGDTVKLDVETFDDAEAQAVVFGSVRGTNFIISIEDSTT